MTAYEQGFLRKCAEYGIDGKAFLKVAQAILPKKPAAPKLQNMKPVVPGTPQPGAAKPQTGAAQPQTGAAKPQVGAAGQAGQQKPYVSVGSQAFSKLDANQQAAFRQWAGTHGKNFGAMFKDKNGQTNREEYDKFFTDNPNFLTASDSERNTMWRNYYQKRYAQQGQPQQAPKVQPQQKQQSQPRQPGVQPSARASLDAQKQKNQAADQAAIQQWKAQQAQRQRDMYWQNPNSTMDGWNQRYNPIQKGQRFASNTPAMESYERYRNGSTAQQPLEFSPTGAYVKINGRWVDRKSVGV